MVFQHGLCGDAAQPAQVFPDDAGFRRLTLECRGHGRSEPGPSDQFSIDTFTNDVAEMITSHIGAPVVIGGISMGAAISLRLAVTRPELVSAVVLARPAWLTEPAPGNMSPNAIVGELLRRHTPEEARAQFDTTPVAADLAVTGPDNLVSLRNFFSRKPIAVTAELLTRISADGPGVSESDLKAMKAPTLVVGHGRDFVHPLAYAHYFAQKIPGARLVEITPKATDPVAYAQDFRSALASFLKGL